MDFHIGDEVITAPGLWHNGQDISNRLAKIISITGHILINVYGYDSNPVKCFRYEIKKTKIEQDNSFEDIYNDFEIEFDD